MPFDIIHARFGIVPPGIRAKKKPKKGAKCFPFNLPLEGKGGGNANAVVVRW